MLALAARRGAGTGPEQKKKEKGRWDEKDREIENKRKGENESKWGSDLIKEVTLKSHT